MKKTHVFRLVAAVVGLLAVNACAPTNSMFQISGYDSEGIRTGTLIPSPGTLTPY